MISQSTMCAFKKLTFAYCAPASKMATLLVDATGGLPQPLFMLTVWLRREVVL